MNTIVMKFGGASLKDVSFIQKASEIIINKKKSFDNVIVVVSAMGNTTDKLLNKAYSISKNPPNREVDMLISAGERISMSLLSISLYENNCEAVSFTGSQAGIITTSDHANAEILEIRSHRIRHHLEKNKVVVIAGFQGVSKEGEITTLGRGGSDLSAVALGVEFNCKVEFYKDTLGIFEKDPKIFKNSKLFSNLNYQQAKKIISNNSHEILQKRCLDLAEKHNILLHILSCDKTEDKGTIINLC